MNIEGHLLRRFDNGAVLDVIADGMPLRAYVAICAPDPEAVTAFVPPEQFEQGGSLHVAAVETATDAATIVEDVLFNMDPDDAVAFLCPDAGSWRATLEQLGYVPDPSSLE